MHRFRQQFGASDFWMPIPSRGLSFWQFGGPIGASFWDKTKRCCKKHIPIVDDCQCAVLLVTIIWCPPFPKSKRDGVGRLFLHAFVTCNK